MINETPNPPSLPPTSPDTPPPPSPPPPRGVSLSLMLVLALVAAALLAVGVIFGDQIRAAGKRTGIALGGAQHQAHDEDDHAWYTCGMHPWVLQRTPGLCPICHMELTPLDASQLVGQLTIDPVTVQNIGVRVAPAESGAATRTIRAVGKIDYDETRIYDISVNARSRIERWFDTCCIGKPMDKGTPLVELHSPDIIAAAEEMLIARDAKLDPAMLGASKNKLRVLGLPESQIEAILTTGNVPWSYTLHFPSDGVLREITGHVGHWLEAGNDVAEVVDISEIWVFVTIFESQLPFVREGQKATMRLSYLPGENFEGVVSVVYPYLDETTRQARVRLVFDNKELKLKPGMFAEIELHSELPGARVLVPQEAVINTGPRQVVMVSLGSGRFEPRPVRLGSEVTAGRVEIVEGLEAGELVVVSGQFLLDSESRRREALAKMVRGEPAVKPAEPAATAKPGVVSLPPEAAAALSNALNAYFSIADTLAGDSTDAVAENARALAASVERLTQVPLGGDAHFWHRHTEASRAAEQAAALAQEGDIDAIRRALRPLSESMVALLRLTGVPASFDSPVEALRCPMYPEQGQNAHWLQRVGEVRNPYYGGAMLRCQDQRLPMPTTPVGE